MHSRMYEWSYAYLDLAGSGCLSWIGLPYWDSGWESDIIFLKFRDKELEGGEQNLNGLVIMLGCSGPSVRSRCQDVVEVFICFSYFVSM